MKCTLSAILLPLALLSACGGSEEATTRPTETVTVTPTDEPTTGQPTESADPAVALSEVCEHLSVIMGGSDGLEGPEYWQVAVDDVEGLSESADPEASKLIGKTLPAFKLLAADAVLEGFDAFTGAQRARSKAC